MIPRNNQDRHRTAYSITTDYLHGTTTGISAHDRALTARALASPTHAPSPSDFARPGHLCPLQAQPGGTLARRGHTEAAIDLCKLTQLPRAGLLCELVNDDEQGSMMRRDECRAFADRWGIKMVSVDMLAEYRKRIESSSYA
jgi:3,4-dihydroxy-2-butanone 4-phosphate synthase